MKVFKKLLIGIFQINKMKNSKLITKCQVCNSKKLELIKFFGYMPPVNQVINIDKRPTEQPSYPTELLHCKDCHLFQLGLIVDQQILFPKKYQYTAKYAHKVRVGGFY